MQAVSKTQAQVGDDFIAFLVQNNLQAPLKASRLAVRQKDVHAKLITPAHSENDHATEQVKSTHSSFHRAHYLAKVAETYLLESGAHKPSAMEAEMDEWARLASGTLDKHSHKAKKGKIHHRIEEVLNKPVLKREHYNKHEFDIFSKTSAAVICAWLLALFVVVNYPNSARQMSLAFDAIYDSSIGSISRTLTSGNERIEKDSAGMVAGAKDSRTVTEAYSDFVKTIFENIP